MDFMILHNWFHENHMVLSGGSSGKITWLKWVINNVTTAIFSIILVSLSLLLLLLLPLLLSSLILLL